jgi:hypothetical protein
MGGHGGSSCLVLYVSGGAMMGRRPAEVQPVIVSLQSHRPARAGCDEE